MCVEFNVIVDCGNNYGKKWVIDEKILYFRIAVVIFCFFVCLMIDSLLYSFGLFDMNNVV